MKCWDLQFGEFKFLLPILVTLEEEILGRLGYISWIFHDIPMFPQKIEPFTHPLGPRGPLRLTGLPPDIGHPRYPRESQHGLGNPL